MPIKRRSFVVLTSLALLLLTPFAQAVSVKSGSAAPEFELMGHDGKKHKLSDFKGKFVVLEWFNQGCPYVKKHYGAPELTMQNLQKKYTAKKNIVWLQIVSSAKGKQGYVDLKGASKMIKSHKAHPTFMLLDPEGSIGKAYDAQTTPHMYLIAPDQKLIYQGAIDDRPSAKPASLKGATPLFAQALDAALSGKNIDAPITKPYGCSVKYK